MKINPPQTLAQIADIIGCKFIGNKDHLVSGINEIHRVEPGDLVFVDHPKYYNRALESAANTILINKEVECPPDKGLIISEQPARDFDVLTKHFAPFVAHQSDRGENFKMGKGTTIFPGVIVGNNVSIGEDCIIFPGVVIGDEVTIENRVIIHANAVLGSHAFYYNKKEGIYNKMHTVGSIHIEDDVEIGASCTIDRGLTAVTRIGKGSKLDNQVHVGHDVLIGENCLFAAQVGIAGCVTIEDNVTLWGQVGVASGLKIGKGAAVMGQSGLMSDLEGGKSYLGSPAIEARKRWKEIAAMRLLPKIVENLE